MRNEQSRALTSEIEVEMLLRESASCDLFGLPPPNLVENALAAVAEPCEEGKAAAAVSQQRQTALIVIALAAVGLFVAALPEPNRRDQKHEAAAAPHLSLDRPKPDSPATDRPYQTIQAMSQPANEHVVRSSAMEPHRMVEAPPITERRHTELKAVSRTIPKAMWTTTIVTETEQGIVVPVNCVTESDEDGPDRQGQPGVAVVPLQSGTTYTSCEGAGP